MNLSRMSVVYLRIVEFVWPIFLTFISMKNLGSVNLSSMEAAVETTTDLELWRIVKKDVSQKG